MTPTPRALRILEIVSFLLLAAAIWMVFFYAPLEAVMGAVQKVFYFHVATAWVGMLGFIAAGVSGIIYLRTQRLEMGHRRSRRGGDQPGVLLHHHRHSVRSGLARPGTPGGRGIRA